MEHIPPFLPGVFVRQADHLLTFVGQNVRQRRLGSAELFPTPPAWQFSWKSKLKIWNNPDQNTLFAT